MNFSLTAQQLFVSQPTLSHQIKQLEKELGFELFKRTKREVELTKAGESFYEESRYLLEHLYKGVEKARHYSEVYDNRLVIAYENNSLVMLHLSDILERFHQKYPSIQVELNVTDHVRKDVLFKDEKVDILFTVKDKVTQLSQVAYQELYQGQYMCVLSPKHELAQKETLSFSDLQKQPLILLEPLRCPEEMKQMEQYIITACPNSPITYVDHQMTGCIMARGGLGIAIMPDFICVPDKHIATLPLEIKEKVSYGIVWRTKNVSQMVEDFVLLAKESYAFIVIMEQNSEK